MKKLKAKLRDWLFNNYKWITRAQVRGIICSKQWEHRSDSIVDTRIRECLNELLEEIR